MRILYTETEGAVFETCGYLYEILNSQDFLLFSSLFSLLYFTIFPRFITKANHILLSKWISLGVFLVIVIVLKIV